MSDPISITIPAESLALYNRLQDKSGAQDAMAHAMDQENDLTVAHAQRRYLSFPKHEPATTDGLRVISGSLIRSVRASPTQRAGDGLRSAIGGNVTNKGVNYLAVHEEGATIPAHTVKAAQARALCFFVGGTKVFAKSAKIPEVTLPARRPIHRAIEDRLPDYGKSMGDALTGFLAGAK
jgi:hypothetical protein